MTKREDELVAEVRGLREDLRRALAPKKNNAYREPPQPGFWRCERCGTDYPGGSRGYDYCDCS